MKIITISDDGCIIDYKNVLKGLSYTVDIIYSWDGYVEATRVGDTYYNKDGTIMKLKDLIKILEAK